MSDNYVWIPVENLGSTLDELSDDEVYRLCRRVPAADAGVPVEVRESLDHILRNSSPNKRFVSGEGIAWLRHYQIVRKWWDAQAQEGDA